MLRALEAPAHEQVLAYGLGGEGRGEGKAQGRAPGARAAHSIRGLAQLGGGCTQLLLRHE